MSATDLIRRGAVAALIVAQLALPAFAEPLEQLDAEHSDTAGSSPAPAPWLQRARSLQLSQLGLSEDVRKRGTRARIDLVFRARADELLNGGTLTLGLHGADASSAQIGQLEVVLNGTSIATIPRALLQQGPARRQIALQSDLLGAKNVLSLHLVRDGSDRSCALVPAGSWKIVREGTLLLTGRKLPVANDLSQLPLPFIDPEHDRQVTVAIAFASAPSLEQLKAATAVAAYLGVHGAIKVGFEVHVGTLPKRDVVVLLDHPQQAARLGLVAGPGSRIALVPHPRDRENLKALVLSGRDTTALQRLAERLAIGSRGLKGASVALAELKEATRAIAPAKHWVREHGRTEFSKIVGSKQLVHRGTREETLVVQFRAAPDLFIWPGESATVDVRYRADYPEGSRPPLVAFEFNQRFIESLPISPGGATQSARLEVPRELLRGYNEMRFHLSYHDQSDSAESEAYACAAEAPQVDAAFTILGDSTIELKQLKRFRELPDLDLFLYDGYPFTRAADLGQTVAVLPDDPQPSEVATLLSVVAHLAEVTGRAGTGIELRTAADVLAESSLNKDVLLVGVAQRHPLLRQWRRRSPLRVTDGRLAVNANSPTRRIEQLLRGRGSTDERERIRERLKDGAVSAVISFRSPLHRQRSVVAVTSAVAARMPAMGTLQGYADSRHPTADVLLRTERGRFLFRLGPTYAVGQVGPLTWARWSLSRHWLLMLASLLLAACLFGWVARRFLADRAHRRLAGAG